MAGNKIGFKQNYSAIMNLTRNQILSRILIMLVAILTFASYTKTNHRPFNHHYHHSKEHHQLEDCTNDSIKTEPKYLINTSTCHIPDVDPFSDDVKKFYHREEYVSCSERPPLTYIEETGGQPVLKINQSLLSTYSTWRVHCCYSSVARNLQAHKPDETLRISDCVPFEESAIVTDPVIKVTCRNFLWEVYANVHGIISNDLKPKREDYNNYVNKSALSVLLLGIDSISKLNLVRTMPRTYQFLENGGDFINLKGYVKIGENTFPNLMGMLTGKSRDQVGMKCDYDKEDMNECGIIWDNFRDVGYLTAYGEDAASIGTFNYLKRGFLEAPTDFYFRSYTLAAEKLGILLRNNMDYCSGPENSAERILNLAKQFANYSQSLKFGLFWINSFSHDDLNLPSAMDEKVLTSLQEIYQHLDDTILFFFSDHGFRFGSIRYTTTGWLEERLPYFYVHFPDSFKKLYPEHYQNFKANSERLTTPYDIFMTLQDILSMANSDYKVKPSEACPKCRSLFEEVLENRTCDDAAINERWCVCNVKTYVNPKEKFVADAAQFIIVEINKLINSYSQSAKCNQYSLKKVMSADLSEIPQDQDKLNLLLRLETKPRAMFEASMAIPKNLSSDFHLLGDISRIDQYSRTSYCIEDSALEKYCHCKQKFHRFVKDYVCKFMYCV